jgi:hypothetical protein
MLFRRMGAIAVIRWHVRNTTLETTCEPRRTALDFDLSAAAKVNRNRIGGDLLHAINGTLFRLYQQIV